MKYEGIYETNLPMAIIEQDFLNHNKHNYFFNNS